MHKGIHQIKIQTPVPFPERENEEEGYHIVVIGFSPKNFQLLADRLHKIGSHSPLQWDTHTNWLRVSFYSNESYEMALKLHDSLLDHKEKIAVFSENSHHKPRKSYTSTVSTEPTRIIQRKEKKAFKILLEYLFHGWL